MNKNDEEQVEQVNLTKINIFRADEPWGIKPTIKKLRGKQYEETLPKNIFQKWKYKIIILTKLFLFARKIRRNRIRSAKEENKTRKVYAPNFPPNLNNRKHLDKTKI